MCDFKIITYEKTNGEKPVENFIHKLDYKTKYKVLSYLQVLKERGNNVRFPFSKHLEDEIFELRCRSFISEVRILYFFTKDMHIILTNAFFKKSNKTPSGEILVAKQRRKDFLERNNYGNI